MSGAAGYELVCELVAHQGDTRALCALGADRLVSGSRDRLGKVWSVREGGRSIGESLSLYDHEHWGAAVCAVPGGFATACHDSKIRWYGDDGALLATLAGHQAAVTSLCWNAATQELLSGSWDGTARSWALDAARRRGECTNVYEGHENGVCVLALPGGDLVTGSAGVQSGNGITGFQLRVWRAGRVVRSLKDHAGAVRGLCLLSSGAFFASCSNDGSARVYSSESFECVQVLRNPPSAEGQPAFNFSLCALAGNAAGELLAVACDDCCARLWDASSGALLQEVMHPCTVWAVCALPSGDLVTGGADGVVRVFSREPARQAAPAVRDAYAEVTQAAAAAIAAKQSNQGKAVDVSKLANILEAKPGQKDGDVKMFNKEGVAWVYQWQAESQAWVEVGEVMGGDDKEEVDGELFDKVIPVELEDPATGGLRKLKLGINQGDNPYEVAQRFVQKYELNQNHVEEIAQFVQRVRGQSSQPVIDMSGGAGASASASGGNSGSSSSSSMELDRDHAPPRSARAPEAPFPLPRAASALVLDQAELDKALVKLLELNGALRPEAQRLGQTEQAALLALVAVLKDTSRYHASVPPPGAVQALARSLAWDDAQAVWPALDVARIALTHPECAAQLCRAVPMLLDRAAALAGAEGAPLALSLLGARCCANLFRHMAGAECGIACLAARPAAAQRLAELAGHPNKNLRNAVATALLNAANALCHAQQQQQQLGAAARVAVAVAALAGGARIVAVSLDQMPAEQETVRRALLAIGCAAVLSPGALADAPQDMPALLTRAEQAGADKALIAAIKQYVDRARAK